DAKPVPQRKVLPWHLRISACAPALGLTQFLIGGKERRDDIPIVTKARQRNLDTRACCLPGLQENELVTMTNDQTILQPWQATPRYQSGGVWKPGPPFREDTEPDDLCNFFLGGRATLPGGGQRLTGDAR